MAEYTQAHRPIRVDTELGPDVLLLTGFSGTEAVSQLFRFTLDMVSTDPGITLSSLHMRPVRISMQTGNNAPDRALHGLVSRFSQGGKRDGLIAYHAELVPWLWFLSLTSDLQIFQDQTTLEIVENVFLAHGYHDFDIRCSHTYAKRDYCVQYRESHFAFVSRLLEEEGIFYFFEHSADRHMLVLADDPSAIVPLAAPVAQMSSSQTPNQDVITTILHEYEQPAVRITLNDWDPLQPSFKLQTSLGAAGQLEYHDYAAGYSQRELGDHYARVRLESQEATAHVVRGASTCRLFESGRRFQLAGHFRADLNREYLLTQVQHVCRAGDFRSNDAVPLDYNNHFACIPVNVPFRPRQVTPRPVVRGPQTAIVMGTPDKDIWTDQYGRVKVRFHWDRQAVPDDRRSCWIRVASFWAGKGWGALHLPRPGHEVVVDFLEGNPDRPLITGSVYNDANRPAWSLPQQENISGIRSRRTPDGSSETYNEIILDDTRERERVAIHAERDFHLRAEGSESRSVGVNSSTQIRGERSVIVGGEKISGDVADTLQVNQGDQLVSILYGDQLISVIEGDQIINVGKGDQITEVGKGNHKITVHDGNQEITIVGNHTLTAYDSLKLESGLCSIRMADDSISVHAFREISFRVGSTILKLSQKGLSIVAPFIEQAALVEVSTNAPIVDIVGTMQAAIKGNVITEVSSPGLVKVVGAGVLIN